MATTAPKTKVTRSSSVNVKDLTWTCLLEAKTKVGAPDDAILQTAGANYQPVVPPTEGAEAEEFLPYSVTFTWSEEI